MNDVNLSDENLLLWSKFRQGDADALAEIMQLHYQDLFNYGFKILHDEHIIKDCLQDLFLYLWEHRLKINETSFVKYYLLKSLRRRLLKVADAKRHFIVPAKASFEVIFNSAPFTDNENIEKENLSELSIKLQKVLLSLPVRQQEIIYLRFFLEADVDEIAEIMDLNTQSVYNLLHRALKKLKSVLSSKPLSLAYFLNIISIFL